jgi:hypothetical protein
MLTDRFGGGLGRVLPIICGFPLFEEARPLKGGFTSRNAALEESMLLVWVASRRDELWRLRDVREVACCVVVVALECEVVAPSSSPVEPAEVTSLCV